MHQWPLLVASTCWALECSKEALVIRIVQFRTAQETATGVASGDQNRAVWKQDCYMGIPNRSHAAGDSKNTGGWIVQFR